MSARNRYAILELLQGKVPLWYVGHNSDGGWSFEASRAMTFDSHVAAWTVVKSLERKGHKDPLHIVPAPSFFRAPMSGIHPGKRKRDEKRENVMKLTKCLVHKGPHIATPECHA